MRSSLSSRTLPASCVAAQFTDLLSGRTLEGEVEVPGYSVMVLKRLD